MKDYVYSFCMFPYNLSATETSLAARGIAEVTVSETYQDEFSILDVGFSYSYSSGGVMYYRSTKSA